MFKSWRFFKEAVCHFKQVGTIIESSRFLIDSLLTDVDFEKATLIVELGAGSGCVTREILKRMRPDARLFSFELSPVFYEEICSIQDARLTPVNKCATCVLEVINPHEVDCVISGLPMGNFNLRTKTAILETIDRALKPNGLYSQFQYSLLDYRLMRRRFKSVRLGFTPANIPPAFVYNCNNG